MFSKIDNLYRLTRDEFDAESIAYFDQLQMKTLRFVLLIRRMEKEDIDSLHVVKRVITSFEEQNNVTCSYITYNENGTLHITI